MCFRLEQNYRSAQMIINAANSLISEQTPYSKTVFSELAALGEKLKITRLLRRFR